MTPPTITILVVDDDPTQLQMLQTFLGKHGYRVLTAPSPIEAMEILYREDIKLVITDLMMPHVDGITFAQQIHAVPRLKNLSVIMMSAWPHEELGDKGMRSGIAITLQKPVELNKLLDLVGFATH